MSLIVLIAPGGWPAAGGFHLFLHFARDNVGEQLKQPVELGE
jgi:hypothetical protein